MTNKKKFKNNLPWIIIGIVMLICMVTLTSVPLEMIQSDLIESHADEVISNTHAGVLFVLYSLGCSGLSVSVVILIILTYKYDKMEETLDKVLLRLDILEKQNERQINIGGNENGNNSKESI